MKIGNTKFKIGKRTFIVGILNVTPDSFSDGGMFDSVLAATKQAKKLQKEGADIIEVGGESTRPGHFKVDLETEIERVIPVIKALNEDDEITVPLAIDTSKSEVADTALSYGVSLVNDVWGFKKDPELAQVCAKYNAICCTMHNRDSFNYTNFIPDVFKDIQESINILIQAGVKPANIIIDPGIGFAKSPEQNIEILRNLMAFTSLPYPLMVGTSKKSFMGKTIGLDINNRQESTMATTVLAISKGANFIRVHNVAENKKAAQMADYIMRHQY